MERSSYWPNRPSKPFFDPKISEGEFFPADLILLNSSAPKGICYIETKNLDGETNMKHKMSHKSIIKHVTDEKSVSEIVC